MGTNSNDISMKIVFTAENGSENVHKLSAILSCLDVLTPLHHFQELDRTSLEYGDPSLEIKNLLTLLHIEEDSFNEFVKNIGLKSLGMQ